MCSYPSDPQIADVFCPSVWPVIICALIHETDRGRIGHGIGVKIKQLLNVLLCICMLLDDETSCQFIVFKIL